MKFYCITSESPHEGSTTDLFEKSCLDRGIKFVGINVDTYNFTHPIKLEKGDCLYRVSTQPRGRIIEKLIMEEGVKTLHSNYRRVFSIYDNTIIFQKYGIPTPKTIHEITADKEKLKTYVERMGGFPLIIKALGGSHGIGVMKVDSLDSLFSIADFLVQFDKEYTLRQFIKIKKTCRLIVLGESVVDSIEYEASKDDFRSNAGNDFVVRPKRFPKGIEDTAVKAVKVLDLEFGGVDILIDESGEYYVSEMNFPCYFPRCQLLTGVDISGKIVDHLINKKV